MLCMAVLKAPELTSSVNQVVAAVGSDDMRTGS